PKRRLVLLATVAGLGAAAMLGPIAPPQLTVPTFATAAHAQSAQRPIGFADIVDRVKPSVISVRVKVDGGSRNMTMNGRDLPPGLGGTVTAGIVSARDRDIGAGPYADFLQIDAPVNKGNSGGPAFDVEGNVIGVNTAIFSPSGGSVGIAFAIPADTVRTVITQLKDRGAVTRGWIGVSIQPVTADVADSLGMKRPEGALVA